MRLWVLCAVGLLASSSLLAGEPEDLEPNRGPFVPSPSSDPYHSAVGTALLDEVQYRTRSCQLVVIPSFQPEWAVYVVREDNSARVITTTFARQLWVEMSRVISDDGRKKSYSLGAEAQTKALATLDISVTGASADLPEETADALAELWWSMLGRVRYPTKAVLGVDGVRYFFSDWASHSGFRSGMTWSPTPESRAGSLVAVAEAMRRLASATPQATEQARRSLATSMLKLQVALDDAVIIDR